MAFEKSAKKGLKELEERIDGPTALIFAKENPFKLFQKFYANRVKAPAKAGQKAPYDIVVPAGDTPFKPGPIIADLQGVGIKAKIQGPIIAVIADSPVIKKDEEFSAQLASVLAQMEIFPMEIGLDIKAALEDGTVYSADVLHIDADKTLSELLTAHQNAVNLAVEAGVYNKESVGLMISNAANSARNLALEAEIYNEETVDYFLSKGDREAKGLAAAASYVPGAASKAEEKKEEKKEEAVEEEKAEEKPAEEAKEAPKEEAKEEAPAEESKEEVPAEEAKEEKPAEEEKKEEAKDTKESS